MNPIAILKEVEADVKAFGSISTDIRSTLKSGVADLTAIRDEMKALVESVKAKATGALSSLKALADEVSKDADGSEGDKSDGGDDKAPAPVVDLSAGTTTHIATDGTVTTLDHEAGTVTARDGDSEPVVPAPEAVSAVVQATVDAGVAVAEDLKPEVSAPAAAAQPVI